MWADTKGKGNPLDLSFISKLKECILSVCPVETNRSYYAKNRELRPHTGGFSVDWPQLCVYDWRHGTKNGKHAAATQRSIFPKFGSFLRFILAAYFVLFCFLCFQHQTNQEDPWANKLRQ